MGRDGVQAAKEREGIGRVVSVGGGWGGLAREKMGLEGATKRERERERERETSL